MADSSTRLPEPFFAPRAPLRFLDGAWQPVAPEDGKGPRALRVLTWNVLFDRYETERIHSARRRPLLWSAIEEADADVIALQEMERASLRQLLSQPFVRARYAVSDGPRGRSVGPYGVVLLSRAPVLAMGAHELTRHKTLLAMVVQAACGPVTVVTLHLTSDHAARGAEKRERQLATLREGLDPVSDRVILGDFNEEGERPAEVLGMRDAWTELRGLPDPSAPERWATFEPARNPLAAICSLTGQPLRLDRVLVGGRVRARGIERVGTTPSEDGLFPSDHYGLVADLAL